MRKKEISSLPLGVIAKVKKEFFFFRCQRGEESQIDIITKATKGSGWQIFAEKIDFGETSKEISTSRIGKLKNGDYFLSYKTRVDGKVKLKGALSRDLINWRNIGELAFSKGELGGLLSGYKWRGNYLFYFGERRIKMAFSPNLRQWKIEKKTLLSPRDGFFDSLNVGIVMPLLLKEGILIVYSTSRPFSIAGALFSKENPRKLLWRSLVPIWTSSLSYFPIGATVFRKDLNLYFGSPSGEINKVTFPLERLFGQKRFTSFYQKRPQPLLEKYVENPILAPRRELSWESQAAFNAAAFYEDDKVHLIYRAIGESNISVLGYANSRDGLHIDERLDEPVYVPTQPFEFSGRSFSKSTSPFISGGSWGGVEDPRITKIDNRYFMTYVAFDGFRPPRVALTSISITDFRNHNWNWAPPVLISPPGVVDKNAVIFPEKINNKYVVMHRIYPHILVDFVEDLDFDGTKFLKGEYLIKSRPTHWDSRKIGAGAPPIKTEKGWLLIYHAVDELDPGKYKIGAMLLDISDPTKVLYRTNEPLLEPTCWYENEGFKAGVAYPCGAAVLGERLLVYYGGADTVTCVAYKDLAQLLHFMEYSPVVNLEPIVNPRSVFAYHG